MSYACDIPDSFLAKWQDTTNVMADIFDVPAGLIMRVLPEQIEVLVSSHGADNPYEADEKAPLHTGLYCETVMATRALLHVPHALEDPHWQNNPDVALNMISYLGVPLLWSDEQVFGTICVLDSKKRIYQSKYIELLWEIKRNIENDFRLIRQQEQLVRSNVDLRRAMALQKTEAMKVAQANGELNVALARLTALQDELLRSEKMAALGSLVAGISHELNTPIGSSLLAASTLQNRAEEFSAALEHGLTRSRLHEFIDTVREGSAILMRTLGQANELVGSFKQVAADESSAYRRTFRLDEAVSEVVVNLAPALHNTGHRIDCAIPADIEFDSYPGPLCQVLSNLLGNALLHAFDGRERGTVRIAAALAGNGQVRLSVHDDGVGIPQNNLKRVFDPFFTTRLGHGGSGLGLHIAYRLVSATLHGSIEASSAPGDGACFTLLLPLVAPDALYKLPRPGAPA
ncbi:MAG: GAF domain-containing sensor histidine kinase [Pseudomonadota bacterium]